MATPPEIGDILVIRLPDRAPPGHEQTGLRPVVVVGLPDRVGSPRYPLIVGVPLTTQEGAWVQAAPALYPTLDAGKGGLPRRSIVLLDQIAGIDGARVVRRLGRLTAADYAPIRAGLQQMLQL